MDWRSDRGVADSSARDQANHEQDEEHEEQHLANHSERTRDARETENSGNQSHDKKS